MAAVETPIIEEIGDNEVQNNSGSEDETAKEQVDAGGDQTTDQGDEGRGRQSKSEKKARKAMAFV